MELDILFLFLSLLEGNTHWQGLLDDLPVHLGSLEAWFACLPIGIFYIFEKQYGPSEMLDDPGRILCSSWWLQHYLWSHWKVSICSIYDSQWYQGNSGCTPGGHLCHLGSSGIAWRWNQLSVDSQNSLNSSYWSDVVHSKVGVFKLVAGWFGISDLRASVRTARVLAVVSAGSFGWAMTAMYDADKDVSLWDVIQTWDLDRSFPQGQWRFQTALAPQITTRGTIGIMT